MFGLASVPHVSLPHGLSNLQNTPNEVFCFQAGQFANAQARRGYEDAEHTFLAGRGSDEARYLLASWTRSALVLDHEHVSELKVPLPGMRFPQGIAVSG
jgi:hypothetical protein